MSSSDGRGPGAAGSLDSLSNPELASMTAADLVVHLYKGRRGSDFADVALVLAARERSAADAEARIRAAAEVAGRLRAEIRRAAGREARLRAEIRALERRADEAEARARLGSSDISGRAADGTAASEDGQAGGMDIKDGEVKAELGLGAQGPAAASEEDAGADVDPDDTLTLNQYLENLAAESGAESNSPRDDDAWGNLRALAIVSPQDDLALAPLEVIPPGYNTTPNHGLKAQKRLFMDVGGMGDDNKLQNNAQDLHREVASPLLASKGSSEVDGNGGSNSGGSDTESSPVALHSEAGGIKIEPSNSTVPPSATGRPREKGIFYKMVLKALHEREKRTLAKAPASQLQQLKLRCWLYAPLPSAESVALEDDRPHGEAPQK
ncbi:hypothetical protein GQ55_2G359400 [Panicum hallii var. hallii]|uniref:Uncharacterized protein n=1 Tax=Panicum hallii var. hallii TaxID=1504633 RepID=A0A2T7EW18_9POAL|nr:hypothetical protein GQ55_2G359400 [Panicum hallii var. hallii]